MLKFQITLIAILIGCVAFVSCERAQKVLEPATDDMMAGDDMTMDMTMDMMMDMTMHKSWMHVMLPAPGPQAEATSPAETGEVHGMGTRTVYINEAGIMAMKDMSMTAFPAGTMIVKEIMDDTNMFVQKIATMMKADGHADHNGWIYKKYARADENAEYMQVRGAGLEDAGNGCHGCHVKADHDSVFVVQQFLMTMMEDDMGDGMMEDDMDADDMGDGMMEDDMDADGMDDGMMEDDMDADGMDDGMMEDDMDADDMMEDDMGDDMGDDGAGDGAAQ